MTLLDFPGKVACTVFTGGCNFRCPFCHNALLVLGSEAVKGEYSTEEILSFLEKRVGLLDGVAITGGEPLLQPDIEDFISRVKAMGYAVKLDTNGSFPDKLISLVDKKLVDYVAVDIKNCKEKYGLTVGKNDFDLSPIEKTVEFLLQGHVPYEFRTTIVKEFHTVSDIEKISHWIKGAQNYFLQNFVDSGNLIKEGLHAVEKETLQKMREIALKNLTKTEIRGV